MCPALSLPSVLEEKAKMRTSEVIRALRTEGYEITSGYLDFLFRKAYLSRPAKEGAFSTGVRLTWPGTDGGARR